MQPNTKVWLASQYGKKIKQKEKKNKSVKPRKSRKINNENLPRK